jgi:hypothetical protein
MTLGSILGMISRLCVKSPFVLLGSSLALSLVGMPVLGNGGPVDSFSSSPTGDVRPIEMSKVRLVSERLTIDLGEDGEQYTANAMYELMNSAAPVEVTFGVPLVVGPRYMSDCSGATDVWEGQCDAVRAASSVRLSVEEREYHCRLAGRPQKTEREEVRQVWCVASVSVPRGNAIKVRLRYRGSLEFFDTQTTFSALREYGPRLMVYDVSAAGYWEGLVRDIEVRINPGVFADLVNPLNPDGWTRDGPSWILRGHDVDLKKMGGSHCR